MTKRVDSVAVQTPHLNMRRQSVIFAACLLFAAGLYISKLDTFQVGVYMDDACYVTLSRALASHQTYGYINDPDTVLPSRYPFGFPLALAPLVALYPNHLLPLQVFSMVFTLLNGMLLFGGASLFGWDRPAWLRPAVPGLYLVSPMVSGHAVMVMSEPFFLFWVLISLIVVLSCLRDRRKPVLEGALLALALFMACVVRTLGLTMLVTAVLALLWRRRFAVLFSAVIGLAVLTILALLFLPIAPQDFGFSAEYVQQLHNAQQYDAIVVQTDPIGRVPSLLWSYASEGVFQALVPVGGGVRSLAFFSRLGLPFVPALLGLVTGMLIIAGGWVEVRRGNKVPALFTVFYLGALLFWPFYLPRFLYPLLPFLYMYLFVGVGRLSAAIVGRVPGRSQAMFAGKVVLGLCLAVLLCASIVKSLPTDTSLQHTRDLSAGALWLREHAATDAVVLAEQPQAVFVYSDRTTIDFPADAQTLAYIMKSRHVDYLLIAPDLRWTAPLVLDWTARTRDVVWPLVKDYPDRFRLVYSNAPQQTFVYEVVR